MEKADVYSFGIILWEIIIEKNPYTKISCIKIMIAVNSYDLRPRIYKTIPEPLARLMKRCWDRIPTKRPSFQEIIYELEIIRAMNLYQK